jgi:AraC-like DNA-binding protein
MDLVWTGAELVVAGPDTVAHHGRRTRGVTLAGLRFLPGALPSLLDVPAAPLQNQRVALVDLAPGPARAALARLEEGAEPVSVLVALAAKLPGGPPDRSVAALRRALAPVGIAPSGASGTRSAPTAAGGLWAPPRRERVIAGHATGSVAALADALGCTPRSVHRRCQAAFGYGPAVLRRVLRFRRAATLLRAGVSPAEVAVAAGYADQPHLSRETRALAGVSPGQLVSGANRSTLLPSGSSTTA